MQDFSTVMVKNAATGTTDIVNSTNTPKKGIVPGFEFALALMATGAIIVLRKQSLNILNPLFTEQEFPLPVHIIDTESGNHINMVTTLPERSVIITE